MSILRLSTLSLTLAVAVTTLGYVAITSTAFAHHRPGHGGGPGGDPGAGITYTVELQGTFEFDAQSVTVEADHKLKGDAHVTIVRPGLLIGACDVIDPIEDADIRAACQSWGDVFDVCGIYEIFGPDPYGPDEFTAPADRKGWDITASELDTRVVFRKIPIASHISPEPLEVSLQLISGCSNSPDDPAKCDSLIPEPTVPVGDNLVGTSTIVLIRQSNHARAKGGAAHAQECHAKSSTLGVPSTLVITATKPQP